MLYVDEGDVITSAGTAAGIDACLHVVRLEHGAAMANELARSLVVAPHRDGGQTQFVPVPVDAPTARPTWPRLHDWALGHLHHRSPSPDLAAGSTCRRGRSPAGSPHTPEPPRTSG